MSLTGSKPKLVFGDPAAPTCELSLDRVLSRLESTCEILQPSSGGRRLHEDDVTDYKAELDALQAKLANLSRVVEDLAAKSATSQ